LKKEKTLDDTEKKLSCPHGRGGGEVPIQKKEGGGEIFVVLLRGKMVQSGMEKGEGVSRSQKKKGRKVRSVAENTGKERGNPLFPRDFFSMHRKSQSLDARGRGGGKENSL